MDIVIDFNLHLSFENLSYGTGAKSEHNGLVWFGLKNKK